MGEVQEDLARKGASPAHLGPLSSYDLEKLHKKHSAAGTDHLMRPQSRVNSILSQERRNAVKQSQYLTYSAKINGRLSSTNYNQQW